MMKITSTLVVARDNVGVSICCYITQGMGRLPPSTSIVIRHSMDPHHQASAKQAAFITRITNANARHSKRYSVQLLHLPPSTFLYGRQPEFKPKASYSYQIVPLRGSDYLRVAKIQ